MIITRSLKRKSPFHEYGMNSWQLSVTTEELGIEIPKTADPVVLQKALAPAFMAVQKLLVDALYREGTMSQAEYQNLMNAVTLPAE